MQVHSEFRKVTLDSVCEQFKWIVQARDLHDRKVYRDSVPLEHSKVLCQNGRQISLPDCCEVPCLKITYANRGGRETSVYFSLVSRVSSLPSRNEFVYTTDRRK